MPKIAVELTQRECAKLASKPGNHPVGGVPGLLLVVKGNSSHWVLRIMVDGKRMELGCGSFRDHDVSRARSIARDLKLQRSLGIENRVDGIVAHPFVKKATKGGPLSVDLAFVENLREKSSRGESRLLPYDIVDLIAQQMPELGNVNKRQSSTSAFSEYDDGNGITLLVRRSEYDESPEDAYKPSAMEWFCTSRGDSLHVGWASEFTIEQVRDVASSATAIAYLEDLPEDEIEAWKNSSEPVSCMAPWAETLRRNSEAAGHAITSRVLELAEPAFTRAIREATWTAIEEILGADRELVREEYRSATA